MHVVAKTGEIFASFGPYVAAIRNGSVVFTAKTSAGAWRVFAADSSGATTQVTEETYEASSHPARGGGVTSFYARSIHGHPCLCVVGADGAFDVADGGPARTIEPLGPTMCAHGSIAYRVTIDGRACIARWSHEDGITIISRAGEGERYDGLPVALGDSRVVYRRADASGRVGYFFGDGATEREIVAGTDRFTNLGRFPSVSRSGALVFAATERGEHHGIFAVNVDRGEPRRLVESAGFESFRGAVIDDDENVTFFATPIGGELGVYRLTDRRRMIGVGDRLGDWTVREFALNPVSAQGGDIAVRAALDNGTEVIVAIRAAEG